MHGAAYRALGLHGWHYDMIECDEPGLPPLIDGMGPEWAGLSLTMPLKRVGLAVADEVSPLARAVGAANTLVFPPGGPAKGRRAENTDVAAWSGRSGRPGSPRRSRRSSSARAARPRPLSPRCASWVTSHRSCWCATWPAPASCGRPPNGSGCGRRFPAAYSTSRCPMPT